MNQDSEDTPYSSLAERIRICARIAGSGDSLARMSGIPRRTLENYLSAQREPKASTLWAIASAVGVSANWLLGGVGPMYMAAVGAGQKETDGKFARPDQDPKFKLACKLAGAALTVLRQEKLLNDCDEDDFADILLGLIEIEADQGGGDENFRPNYEGYRRLLRFNR